jgi:DNA end-binding protein Ku
VMRDHEYLVAIISEGGVLRAETLRFADELHAPNDIGLPKRKKAPRNRVTSLSKEIAALTQDELDPHELSDQYAQALEELADRKHKADKDVVRVTGADDEDAEAGASNVIDLMAVLRRSISPKATVTTAEESAEATSQGRLASDSGRKRPIRKTAPKKSASARKTTKARASRK